MERLYDSRIWWYLPRSQEVRVWSIGYFLCSFFGPNMLPTITLIIQNHIRTSFPNMGAKCGQSQLSIQGLESESGFDRTYQNGESLPGRCSTALNTPQVATHRGQTSLGRARCALQRKTESF